MDVLEAKIYLQKIQKMYSSTKVIIAKEVIPAIQTDAYGVGTNLPFRVVILCLRLKLFDRNDIIVKDVRMRKYANIMFTLGIYQVRDAIHSFLKAKGIFYAGCFREWDYLWAG